MALPFISIASMGKLYDPFFISPTTLTCTDVGNSFPEFTIQYLTGDGVSKDTIKPFFLRDRVRQIETLNCQTLSYEELCNVSDSLERTLKFVPRWEKAVFFKKKQEARNLFSFIVDLDQQCFHVLLKKKSPFLAEGTFKKVRAAISVPFDTDMGGMVSAYKSSKLVRMARGFVDGEASERRYKYFREEKLIESKYACCTEVLFKMTYFHDTMPWARRRIRRYCVIEKLYIPVSSFCGFAPNENDWFQLTKGLMEGLLELYEDGRFHGDVKTSNALWGNEPLVAKWTDFGFSYRFEEVNRLQGSYGSITCTAPELIGEFLRKKEDILAAEAWAFGFLLFSLLREDPSWSDSLYKLICENKDIPSPGREEVISMMREYLGSMDQIVEKETPSFLGELAKISLRLLRIDRAERYTIQDALEHLMKASVVFNITSA